MLSFLVTSAGVNMCMCAILELRQRYDWCIRWIHPTGPSVTRLTLRAWASSWGSIFRVVDHSANVPLPLPHLVYKWMCNLVHKYECAHIDSHIQGAGTTSGIIESGRCFKSQKISFASFESFYFVFVTLSNGQNRRVCLRTVINRFIDRSLWVDI